VFFQCPEGAYMSESALIMIILRLRLQNLTQTSSDISSCRRLTSQGCFEIPRVLMMAVFIEQRTSSCWLLYSALLACPLCRSSRRRMLCLPSHTVVSILQPHCCQWQLIWTCSSTFLRPPTHPPCPVYAAPACCFLSACCCAATLLLVLASLPRRPAPNSASVRCTHRFLYLLLASTLTVLQPLCCQ
jgi:hypothetical protein